MASFDYAVSLDRMVFLKNTAPLDYMASLDYTAPFDHTAALDCTASLDYTASVESPGLESMGVPQLTGHKYRDCMTLLLCTYPQMLNDT